jgi:hypothetical protein
MRTLILVFSFLFLVLVGTVRANELIDKKLMCKGLGKWDINTGINRPYGLHFISANKVKIYTPYNVNEKINEKIMEYKLTAKEISFVETSTLPILFNDTHWLGLPNIINRQNLTLNASKSEEKKCEVKNSDFDFIRSFSVEIEKLTKEIKLKNKI